MHSFTPPKYEVYQALLKADGAPWAIDDHREALRLDSTFMLARIYLYYSSFMWESNEENAASRAYILEH